MNAGMRRSPTKSLVFSGFWRRGLFPPQKKRLPVFGGLAGQSFFLEIHWRWENKAVETGGNMGN